MSDSAPAVPRARRVWSIALAVGYAAVFVPFALRQEPPGLWFALAAVPVQVACLLARWRWPRFTLVISLVVTSLLLVSGWSSDPCVASALVLYAAIVDAPAPSRQALWTAWIMLVGTVAVLVAVGVGLLGSHLAWSHDPLALLLAPIVLAASWAFGCTLAAHRAHRVARHGPPEPGAPGDAGGPATHGDSPTPGAGPAA